MGEVFWHAILRDVPFDQYAVDPRVAAASRDPTLEQERRYVRNGRDLARYVHRDFTFQAFLNAALLLLSLGEWYLAPMPYAPRASSIRPRTATFLTEAGFSTFGPAQVLDAVAAVANLALHAAWRQKWVLHMRLRPEAYAQRLDRVVSRAADYPVHTDLRDSSIREFLDNRNLLLPMAYPEGAPAHPSYPAGHAAIAGACVTVLKAFFREDEIFPAPVGPSEDGRSLQSLPAVSLTIGGELNKLASNIAIARDFAGVHYRSDGVEGLKLGEAVALTFLEDMRGCLTERFDGFALTSFSGQPILI